MDKRTKEERREDSKIVAEFDNYDGDGSETTNKIKALDHFWKSLMFQTIFDDADLCRDERDILLVIFRQTYHFNKMWDRISIQEFVQKAGPCEKKTRLALKRLEAKALIDIKRSKGGSGTSRKKFNAYRISIYLFNTIDRKWNSCRKDRD